MDIMLYVLNIMAGFMIILALCYVFVSINILLEEG